MRFLIPLSLSFFGGGGGRYGRGGFHNARQQGRKQHGNTPMDNQSQNKQIDAAAQYLGIKLTPQQRDRVHREVGGQGLGFKELVEIMIELFGIN